MNSSKFVNPETRIAIFEEIREEQMHLYKQRFDLLNQLDTVRPTVLAKSFVNDIDEKLRMFNEESSSVFDNLVDKLASDMNNTNEDIDIAEADLLDFMQKNDAELEDGETFEGIMM
jgi:regulator of PEP synthase PpsR (kinase-PPPase family)